jgi:hypothetical protein
MHICLALYQVLNHFVSSQKRGLAAEWLGAHITGIHGRERHGSASQMRGASCQRFKRILIAIID